MLRGISISFYDIISNMDKIHFNVALEIGQVSEQGKIVIGWNKDADRHKKYKMKCIHCEYETDTSIKSFHNVCKKCSIKKTNSTSKERQLWNRYKSKAIKLGLPFNISEDDFAKIIYKNCYYCGIEPKQVIKLGRKIDHTLIYNGVDRKINKIGYTAENCVACCWICNQAKKNYPIEDFKKMIEVWYKKSREWNV